jgi:AcrR family transcriptional regulator
MSTKPARVAGAGGKSKPTSAKDETDTKQRVIESALECIIELGFYRGSSTNEIARRAGVTWGVIQHYFGTREGLMLAVLQNGTAHLEHVVAQARIDGKTAQERLTQLIDVLVTHYARPEYLASLQILLNLEHDPRTSAEVRETMRGASERSQANINRLLREALGPKTAPELAGTIFLVVRGFGFSQQLTESIAYGSARHPQARLARQRALLAEVLAPYFERAG